jgi:YD repeat-containing protein
MAGSKSYGYDDNGNLTTVSVGIATTTLTWDYNDKLTGITYPNSSTNSFVTDDLGQRVSKTDSAGTTTSLFDGDRVLADSRADYTNGGVTGLIGERAASVSKVYHGDQLGSTCGPSNGSQAITDAGEYYAWGWRSPSAGVPLSLRSSRQGNSIVVGR